MASLNPAYAEYFADPFAWFAEGSFYAIGTGLHEAQGTVTDTVFPVLRSPDLTTWEFIGRALQRPAASLGSHFWAPEVAFSQGTYYLYYSVGFEDKNHQLRVAASARPAGPFEDLGLSLIDPAQCPFAIDPHPFQDRDGNWYLYYARDFLESDEHERAGTGLMVAKMVSMTRLRDQGTKVLRARYDWQRFRANRTVYGRAWDWHTLEGPCVRRVHGRYYCFFSGGCWENESYGVDYALAQSPVGPFMNSESDSGPRVIKTVPGRLRGPGHNSIVTDRSGQDHLVFHAWNAEGTTRQMHILPLQWADNGPRCGGAAPLPNSI